MTSRFTRPVVLGSVLVGVAVLVGIGLRSAPLFADFPTGDGGLFWVMANELRDASFVPPETTSYNRAEIPWVYPPLGLYLAAALGGGLEWFRILPSMIAIATIPAVWLLARRLVGSRAAMVAAIAYALAPSAYQGLTAGGGVTRAPGVLFAVLTLWAVADRRVITAGILGGLTLLTHPLAAFNAAAGSVTLWATRGAPRSMIAAPLIAAAIGLIWIAPMILWHGIEPLLSGIGSRGGLDPSGSLILLGRLLLYPPTLAGVLGVLGAAIAVWRGRWDLVAWLVVTTLGVGVAGRWTIIPLAVLAGYAIDAALDLFPSRRSVGVLAVAAIVAVIGLMGPALDRPITPDERSTMNWVREHTPPAAVVAVIGYPADGGVVEWFPALSERHSATTAQGTEWLPSGDRWDAARSAVSCRSLDCLPAADYYVLRPDCCEALAAELNQVGPNVYERRP